jgi:ubiquinone/menaquinone biosynthesis C-methylase UbiE
MSASDINDVRLFWENHPLFEGESRFELGSIGYFEEHKETIINDCLAGQFDNRILPKAERRRKVLDLGCGPGFWTIEFLQRGCTNVIAADLTENALQLTKKRLFIYGLAAELSQQNAESMTFSNGEFSHVNCQGVIHHTPNTESCIKEIARVLDANGSACISVYYKNIFLHSWSLLKYPVQMIMRMLGGGLKGRGREKIFFSDDVNEIVRLYDGDKNPIGKAYSKREFRAMLQPYFEINQFFLHFFPARALPFKLSQRLHKFLDRNYGFMIFAVVHKKDPVRK